MSVRPQTAGRLPAAEHHGVARRGAGRVWPCLDRLVANSSALIAVVGITAVLMAFAHAMDRTSYLIWGGFWVAPVLFTLSLAVANRAARLDGDGIRRLLIVAAACKIFVMPPIRYWMAFGLYGGVSDASRYHRAGETLAPLFRQGIYRDLGEISGTRFLEILTGHVYAVIGPTRLGGFMVFSFLSFLGCYLFFRAFRTVYPEGDGRHYALLVFFFPTLMFWPSSIGKEAFMILVLGAAALGTSQLFAGRLRGLGWLAVGLWGAAVLRPHMALIVCTGLLVATPLAVLRGGARRQQGQRGRLGGVALVLVLLVGGPTLIGVAEEFFELESLDLQTAQDQFDAVTQRTAEGGSTFAAYSPTNPVGFVLAGMTVLFRPFPFEVGNIQALLTALEGLALLALCLASLRRVVRLPRELLQRSYVAFALVYTFAFVYAFSSIVNFGILARQRSQLLPFLFVVISVIKGNIAATQAGDVHRMPDRASASR